uniref:Sulfotransferase domain-containing protein n=1 Tax=Craspedostauros australis TaxID=1486917 RepID=A0A7R9ZST0_9STRA|mmetsp:Transcript_8992/g.24314  ORF Transcript_8992/g.24314 Transcript_8992/m.24314 type:complete len:483 (+) Transcript_8992:132-1580(+)|eukprot:CAMPEP_0198117968 /NCGR_PEP_ID=MMETSP1442-20131203/19882_1 /TAXON_ID= /ORGANISM="Craspedostauros australis, Strain CCMP3328" /LENGTH=482 /DNA_ID=CAMNT_0043776135 /DNA_START=99 /DNA_END=1547 /DNA_ORIENTATION=-
MLASSEMDDLPSKTFTNEIANAAGAREERRKRRQRKQESQQRRRDKQKSSSNHGSSSGGSSSSGGGGSGGQGGGSAIWTVLTIGLLFCLVNVVYIFSRLDAYSSIADVSVMTNNEARQNGSLGNDVAGVASSSSTSSQLLEKHQRKQHQQQHHHQQQLYSTKSQVVDGEKGPILKMLSEAGVHVDPINDKELYDELPTWEEVVGLYGDKPVIYGLDRCQPFQDHSDRADHFVSTAGTFNTGTNLMAELLIGNCHMPDRMKKYGAINRGVRWQVPWGKHTPPGDEQFRQEHKTSKDKDIDATNILPAVTVRDPLTWLGSMCKHEYATYWRHSREDCPNFNYRVLDARIQYAQFERNHESVLHHWNDFYNEYLDVKFDRLIVRFEDLLFHTKEVTQQVCHCAGGAMRKDGRFVYIQDSAKKGKTAHGSARTGFLDAIIKYGTLAKRYASYSRKSDLEYIHEHVDKNLMSIFNYQLPDVDHFDRE